MEKHFHKHAICNDQIINIDDVTIESRKSSKYTCLGCGKEMEACLGQVREHYFRHKNKENCSWESYLHNLAKKKLKEWFDSHDNFFIHYRAENTCHLYDICRLRLCQKELIQTIDLKEFYDTCEVEKTCGDFRPDLLLSHSSFPNRKLFIEINVHHPCTPEKIDSGYRIIEIDVSDERSPLYPFDERLDSLHFFNFSFDRCIIPSSKLERFSLLTSDDSNKEFLIDTIDCFHIDRHLENAEFDIILKKTNKQIKLQFLGLAQAMIHGTPVRHCVFCENCYRCNVPIQKRIVDEKDGKEKLIQQLISPLQLSDNDQWSIARNCRNYVGNRRGCYKLIKDYGASNFILWERNSTNK
jgi:hypothetical protein